MDKVKVGTKIKIETAVRLPGTDIILTKGDVVEVLPSDDDKQKDFSNGKMARMKEQKVKKSKTRLNEEQRKKMEEHFEKRLKEKKEASREPFKIETRSKKYKKFHEAGPQRMGCAVK